MAGEDVFEARCSWRNVLVASPRLGRSLAVLQSKLCLISSTDNELIGGRSVAHHAGWVAVTRLSAFVILGNAIWSLTMATSVLVVTTSILWASIAITSVDYEHRLTRSHRLSRKRTLEEAYLHSSCFVGWRHCNLPEILHNAQLPKVINSGVLRTWPARYSRSPGVVSTFNSSLKGANGIKRTFHAVTGRVRSIWISYDRHISVLSFFLREARSYR